MNATRAISAVAECLVQQMRTCIVYSRSEWHIVSNRLKLAWVTVNVQFTQSNLAHPVCSDDEHSDREPERHRHVCVFLHVVNGCCRGGWHSYVIWQRLRSVPLSHLANKTTSLLFSGYINLRNSADGAGSIRRCYTSRLAEQQRKNCVYYLSHVG